MVVQIDETFFGIMNGVFLALFFLGFRVHIFGMFGGMLQFLFYSWAVSSNINLVDAAGNIVMSFGIITVEPGYGWIGPIFAIIGIACAVIYVRT